MAESVVQEVKITSTYVLIKFNRTLKVSEIDNDNFVVTNVDENGIVSEPFKDIDVLFDYDTISRELSLYWQENKLTPDTNFSIKVTGLYDSASSLIPDSTITFTTASDVSQDPDIVPGSEEDIEIEDHSVRSVISSNYIITSGSSDFYFKGSDPVDGDYYVDTDYNNGRITLKFSEDPQPQYLNTNYFKVQRKPIQRGPVRWETIDAHVSKHGTKPWVFIDYPSAGATPSYNAAYTDYFEPNYKYRIIVSKDVSS